MILPEHQSGLDIFQNFSTVFVARNISVPDKDIVQIQNLNTGADRM